MSSAKNFVQLCVEGCALPDEIDEYIERWHMKKDGCGLKLREFLGMTQHEYAFWMRDPHVIYWVIDTRKHGGELEDYDEDYYSLPLAARAPNTQKAEELTDWLRKMKKI